MRTAAVIVGATISLGGCGMVDQGAPRGSLHDATTVAPTTSAAETVPETTIVASAAVPIDAGDAAASSSAPHLGPLTFSWPTGCTVGVTERVLKDGDTVDLSYGLRLRSDDPRGLTVSFVDMTAVAVNGTPVPPEESDAIGALSMLPSFVVGGDGLVVDVVGTEEMIDELVRMLGDESIRATLSSPEFVATMEDSVASKYWGSWVGLWADVGTVGAERFETTEDVALGGATLGATTILASTAPPRDGLASLTWSQTIDGDEFARLLTAIPGALGVDGADIEGDLAATTGSRLVTIEVTTDPSTLRPSSGSIRTDMALRHRGEVDARTELREWQFDWATSGCIG